jgi:hypothetical protein
MQKYFKLKSIIIMSVSQYKPPWSKIKKEKNNEIKRNEKTKKEESKTKINKNDYSVLCLNEESMIVMS